MAKTTWEISKLDAVNEILAAVKISPVANLDTDGGSDAAEAERTLDRIDYEIQLQGLLENTFENYEITGTGSALEAPDDTIRIEGYGDERKRFYIQDQETHTYIYDRRASNTFLPNGITAHVKLIIKIDFANLSPESKKLIIARAKQKHQRRWVGSQTTDNELSAELLEQERNTTSPGFMETQPNRNFFAGPISQQQGRTDSNG